MTTNWIYLHYWLSVTLFLVGIYGMLIKPNLIRKLMAMNILQVAVIIFFITIILPQYRCGIKGESFVSYNHE